MMNDFMQSLEERIAQVRARDHARWEASGTSLPFDEWRRQDDERQRAEEEAQQQIQARTAALDRQIPGRYRSAETDNPDLHQWVEQLLAWSRKPRATRPRQRAVDWAEPRRDDEPAIDTTTAGPSLLLLGPTGVGKTYAAYGALRAYAAQGGPAPIKIATAADLYAELRPRPGVDAEEVFTGYATAPVLFIDDLGAAKSSEWVEEINYRLVNHRWNHQLATLITSNVPTRELGTYLGERVASRLTGMCSRLTLKGHDRRSAA